PTLILYFVNHTATTELYTLSLHDALPILATGSTLNRGRGAAPVAPGAAPDVVASPDLPISTSTEDALAEVESLASSARLEERERSEEHTSELQSRENLVCRLLLEKKKKQR